MIPVGTRSLLWGVHQVLLHPLLVALAWTRLYGFPTDVRLWIAFFVHDLGYWGKPNMDGPEGETHVELGANLMRRWFGDEWGDFCLYHSRFYARQRGQPPSRLCLADKLVIAIEPWWLYLPRALLSGEVWEYVHARLAEEGKYVGEPETGRYPLTLRQVWALPGFPTADKLLYWHARMADYCREWALVHRDGAADTWTPQPGASRGG